MELAEEWESSKGENDAAAHCTTNQRDGECASLSRVIAELELSRVYGTERARRCDSADANHHSEWWVGKLLVSESEDDTDAVRRNQ